MRHRKAIQAQETDYRASLVSAKRNLREKLACMAFDGSLDESGKEDAVRIVTFDLIHQQDSDTRTQLFQDFLRDASIERAQQIPVAEAVLAYARTHCMSRCLEAQRSAMCVNRDTILFATQEEANASAVLEGFDKWAHDFQEVFEKQQVTTVVAEEQKRPVLEIANHIGRRRVVPLDDRKGAILQSVELRNNAKAHLLVLREQDPYLSDVTSQEVIKDANSVVKALQREYCQNNMSSPTDRLLIEAVQEKYSPCSLELKQAFVDFMRLDLLRLKAETKPKQGNIAQFTLHERQWNHCLDHFNRVVASGIVMVEPVNARIPVSVVTGVCHPPGLEPPLDGASRSFREVYETGKALREGVVYSF